jgi:hypothetical protein
MNGGHGICFALSESPRFESERDFSVLVPLSIPSYFKFLLGRVAATKRGLNQLSTGWNQH